MQNMDEDIVYSVTEKYSRKASEPTTTRSFTTSSLILIYLKEALVTLESLFALIESEFVTRNLEESYRLPGGIGNVKDDLDSLDKKLIKAKINNCN
ncbi:hypothetical protein [Priestia megaterium]|uniref:hypothetical protein n=1 Tax=Priestia megaterium TaxID=1404 RepID=UPI00339085A9